MKAILIGLAIIVAIFIIVRIITYRHAVRHGRCPFCGARITHYANTQFSGMQCTECEWYNIEK